MAAAVTMAASGCSTGPGAATPDPTSQAAATRPPQGQEALASFYEQKLSWSDCATPNAPDAQCADVSVPLDYAKPTGGSTKLRMLKVPASSGKATNGAMLVNPGGPGGSAVDYAAAADLIVTSDVRRTFDLVGVDPRGVGHSTPITCIDAAEMDDMIGLDPTPDDQAEDDALRDQARAFGKACLTKYPQLLPHVSTLDAAKDMDIARATLASPKLNYLGKSYGTFLGATYAGLFPANVGRFVLDGAIAPDLTNDEVNLGQAEGFERATRAYVKHCIAEGDCPLGADEERAMSRLREFLRDVDARPLPVSDGAGVSKLTEGWASTGLAQAMYSQELWDGLTDALRNGLKGDGTTLFNLAEQYAGREDGRYTSNIMQVISAVNCLDRGSKPADLATMEAKEKQFAAKAPTWGPFMAWGSSTCETWPVPPVDRPEKITAAGSGPIVVVGTTRDPATPYEWAQRLASELENGHLVTRDGDGHTGYVMGNTCVDRAVDAYLLQGKTPAANTSC
ncbi:alpha/beta hydrolase [Agilicoccus flavus]|uniref:alpha/beta hydrolase n=1 Tax=Agilicoccus flavus TaxID=2775968 RepID=UPI001CF61780|nr:alpha/beta hydrolase [Agilicoccus flavus]